MNKQQVLEVLRNPDRRVFMHTPKAVRHDAPANRVFVSVGLLEGDPIAWKCDLTKEGLWHPAFDKVLPLTEEGLTLARVLGGLNDSEPTAWFKPDSFYREVTLADLIQEAR